jgi:hypothetical protein
MGISVTYECIDGADSLMLLLEGVRFMGGFHYLIAMNINYVNYAVDKHIFIILLFITLLYDFWRIRWALLKPNIQPTKETIQCFFVSM